MKPDNYFNIANEMLLAAMNETDGLTARTATARVLRLGCKALEQVILDMKKPKGDLYYARQHLSKLTDLNKKEHLLRLRSIGVFLDTFLVAEANAFKKYGVPPNVQKFILVQAEDLISDFMVFDNLEEPSWERVNQNIRELKGEVCSASERLDGHEKTHHLLKKSAYVLSGAGVIGLNASVDAITTLGLTPWMTKISGDLGAKLIDQGLG